MAHGDAGKAASRPARTRCALAATFAVAAAAVGLFVVAQPARAATSGAACAAATNGAQVHFLTDFASGSPDGSAIAGVTVDGFDAGACDGLPVEVIISGNAAGSDADPATELLSTLDSTLDPCTGAKLGAARTIAGGSITLHGCASVHDPNGAAYASMRDATALTVQVADAVVPVAIGGVGTAIPTGSSSAPSSPASDSSAGSGASSSHGVGGVSASRGSTRPSGQSAGGHGLASTGSDIALLTLIGVLLLLGGFVLLQRRRGAREN